MATHSRQLVPLAGASVLAAWDLADTVPVPADVQWATYDAGLWSNENSGSPLEVFPPETQSQPTNDWSLCHVDDTHVHAVRRRFDGSGYSIFDHYVWNGVAWTSLGAMSADPGIEGSGVVLLTDGTNLLAAAIAADGAYTIRYSVWNGTVWSPWGAALGASHAAGGGGVVARNYLAGSGCDDPAHAVLTWTEGTGAYSVVGMDVRPLFP